jgi:hypothetical protein
MLLQMIDLKGEIPNRRPRLLPPNYATEAVNVRMEDGAASPLRAPVDTLTVSALTQTIYRGGNTWRTWNTDVNAVPGPVRAERLYITGDGMPTLVDENGITYALALPEPATGPVVTALQTPDPDLKESIVYAYTWVTALDEESAPSPLSAQVEWSPGVTIRLSGFAARPANRAVNRIRFYRSQTSTSGTTQLFYVGEISAAATFWDHDIVINPIVEPISVAHFGTPPDDLKGLTVLPNGIIAGFYGKTLAFSEPYIPHAWPASYEIQLDFEVVGLAAFGSLLAVMTTGQPYLVDGTHPDSMSALKLEESLPCVSAKGIVDLGYAAAYPSTEGLVLIQRDGPRLVSKQMFSRDQWNALQPASIIAGRHLGRYVMAFDGNLPARAEKGGDCRFLGRGAIPRPRRHHGLGHVHGRDDRPTVLRRRHADPLVGRCGGARPHADALALPGARVPLPGNLLLPRGAGRRDDRAHAGSLHHRIRGRAGARRARGHQPDPPPPLRHGRSLGGPDRGQRDRG